MDVKKIQRRQTIKVIISETVMFLAVILLVAILASIVSGYWINQDFEVERSGLLQISSTPSGANVIIDDKDGGFFQRTNTSKILSSGEHKITVSREGYDTWTKNIIIQDGLLYRLHYPRLFLQDRTAEQVADFGEISFTKISNDSKYLLEFGDKILNLDKISDDNFTKVSLDVTKIFPDFFSGTILDVFWSNNDEKILVKNAKNTGVEWLLIDLVDLEKSINLNSLYECAFDELRIIDSSANNFLATHNGNLYKLNLSTALPKILISNVEKFDYYNDNIVYIAKSNDGMRYVGSLHDDQEIKILEVSESNFVGLSRFYNDEYLMVLDGNIIKLYRGSIPTSISELDSFEEEFEFEISFVPEKVFAGHEGEFYVYQNQNQLATLDMEALKTHEFKVENNKIGWIDNDMIYVVNNEVLIVYDYDGENRREIATGVADKFNVVISEDKWLYYVSDNKLMRENLLPR